MEADDGLPQNSVYGIVQTGDGYLWLATLDGLARFDGVRFTVFNKSNSPGIVNNRFISLFEDVRGDLWAGTEESGIVRYHDGRFSNYLAGKGARIDWIGSDADGNAMSFLSESRAIHFIDGQFSMFDARANFPDAGRVLPRQNVRAACSINRPANLLECYAKGRWVEIPIADGFPDNGLFSAARDADGNFWLVADRRELMRIENGKVVRVYNESSGLPKIPLEFITGAKLSLVSWDGKDSLLLTDLATMQNELLLKTPADRPFETGDIYPPVAIDDTIFKSSYQDDEGNLWFGTMRDGLFRARNQIITAYSKADGIADKNVYREFRSVLSFVSASGFIV